MTPRATLRKPRGQCQQCLLRQKQMFPAKNMMFSNDNQVGFVPKPNQILRTALSQHKTEHLAHCHIHSGRLGCV